MDLCPVSVPLLLLLCFTTVHAENTARLKDEVLINCGSKGTSAGLNGREWLGDVKPRFSSSLQIKGSSSTTSKFTSGDPVPHKTARISRSQFTYQFRVSSGQKIIRLHLYPNSYRGFKGMKDLFTVESGPFTLLGNFSASLTAVALGVNSFVKEFCLYVQENGQLNISFSPSSLDAYAFINGIEIISVPASLSYFHVGDVGVQVVGQKFPLYVDYDTALEVIHRLSVKQSPVPSAGDFDGIFPTWATRKVNQEKSSTWKIPTDMGFRYLIRLYFSELGVKVLESDNVMFKILINELVAHTNVDISKERNNDNIPWYRDYVVMMRGNKNEGKKDLLISLESYDELIDGHGLLAGFEIFKLSNPDNSLASLNPFPLAQDSPSLLLIIGRRNAIATVALTIIVVASIIVHQLREIWEASTTEEEENKPSARAERFCRRFSLAEIKLATENFNYALLIGKGGFGRVYKGLIDKGKTTVAVKRLKPCSHQGSLEFLTEIETLSELRHVNLVSLIGYCNDHGEMILVYDYMACGTLADHLYKLQKESSLTWKQRLDICIGAGRGMDYLHTGHGIIHRDVKTPNILLDENLVAKVSDFGLAKPEDKSKSKSYVSTKVKGTRGYLDPYYFNTHRLTNKSDIFAFGVVLLEVLCGRPATGLRFTEHEHILYKWALDYIRKGEVDQIIASSLRDEISPNSLKTFVGVAERCLCDEPKDRPTMSQIVHQLESALEQHENRDLVVLNETSVSDSIHPRDGEINEPIAVSDGTSPCNDEIINTGKQAVAAPDHQNQTTTNVANPECLSQRKNGRRATVHKPLRLWAWDGIWNRFKPAKKNESSLSEPCEEIGGKDIKLPKFDWNKISVAFCYENQVGKGGFGHVYKAVLPEGQVVAVKRLSPSSARGLKEFMNEMLLLQNLLHRNIIKLLGYSTHGQEKCLIYEFMENKSLVNLLWPSQDFKWPVRFKIIMGIAQGLVYLHQDSRVKLIHKDLKTSNILLDTQMNPKISGLAYASSLIEYQSESDATERHGTYGYMAPEYFLNGKFSVKSDVYSFGIIIMEIVSGRSIQISDSQSTFLLDYAWKLWKERNPLALVDESLGGIYSVEQAQRCIQIALLCIQEKPHDRPKMRSVIKMLNGHKLPGEPQEPWPRIRREDSACSSGHIDGFPSDANINLTNFDWKTIVAITNQFSSSNKVGEGGFGSVYKAVLPTGIVVAVKRLSTSSRQGINEFQNEMFLIPTLQHRNIIELLGYCIHREEHVLVYENMENKSLNTFIDTEHSSLQFNWPVRFKIIMGIARGLEYLHHGSRSRVIHRNLKSGNILLDIEMNPKISGYAFARTLEDDQSECETSRICGTYGYMAPEYGIHGKFSIKSDVYSFGLVMLEIISGGRVIRPRGTDFIVLGELARKLWDEGNELDLVDESLGNEFLDEEIRRCIQIALLCVEMEPNDRPTMIQVIKMLEGNEPIGEPQAPHKKEFSRLYSDATIEFDDTLER